MQRKQTAALIRKGERLANVQPRSMPPMVTRVELYKAMQDGMRQSDGFGILRHPPRYAQRYSQK